jgi:O-antigen/teichoic acid export membrane protein
MAKVAQNFAANVAGTLWGSLLGLVAVPIYLRFVGAEGYGLIGFYTVLASLLTVLDAGFGTAAGRELSRSEGEGSQGLASLGETVRALERYFLVIALLLGALVVLLAPLIATRWINVHEIGHGRAIAAVRLMALVLMLQFPLGLYNGCLMGMQRHLLMNGVNASMATFRVVGAVAVLWLVAPSIEAFFAWQVVAMLANVLLARSAVARLLPRATGRITSGFRDIRAISRFAVGVGGINASGLILTQVDKAALSFLLPLDQFGYYMLAWALSSLIYRLSGPLFTAVFPRMAQLDAQGAPEPSELLFRGSGQLMAVLVIPFSLFLAAYSEEIVRLWTGNPEVARADRWVVALLSAGTMISATMYIPYAAHLAAGRVRPLLLLHVLAAAFMAPLVVLLTMRAGIVGAAGSWLIMNLGFSAGMIWITRTSMDRKQVLRWLLESVALPASVAALFLVAMRSLVAYEPAGRLPLFAALAVGGLCCEAVTTLATPVVRRRLCRIIASRVGRGSRAES